MLNKIILSYILIGVSVATGYAQAKRTVLSAQVYDYRKDMVFFDCVQTPFITQEFHTNPGEIHSYPFDTNRMVALIVNNQNKILLLPGDSLHTVIRYEGKAIRSMEFSGQEQAVRNNQLYWKIEQLKRGMRYKSQLLGCIVLDIKPQTRLNDSRTLLEKVNTLIQEAGKDVSPDVTRYIIAETEAAVYNSFMEYPPMYAETRKLPVDQQEIGDYWSLMDEFNPRDDSISLSCPEYAGLLMRYCFYVKEKSAAQKGETYHRPDTFEKMYHEFASFYEGPQRDFVLFVLISNFIRNGKEIERVDEILEDYKKKHNIRKANVQLLESLLQ